jgi:hypothetical protein
MDEQRCNARVGTTTRVFYTVLETVSEILEQVENLDHEGPRWVLLTSKTGSSMFEPERLVILSEHIATVQEISEVGWLWQKQADDLHYARQLQDLEANSGDRVAAVQEQLLSVVKGMQGDE